MKNFLNQLEMVNNKEELISMKEQFKDQTMDKSLTWEKRMLLYKKIHMINEKLSNANQ